MSSDKTAIAIDARAASSNPLDVIPDQIPFDVPYGLPISLARAEAAIEAAVAEATRRNWKMNVAIADYQVHNPRIQSGLSDGICGRWDSG